MNWFVLVDMNHQGIDGFYVWKLDNKAKAQETLEELSILLKNKSGGKGTVLIQGQIIEEKEFKWP